MLRSPLASAPVSAYVAVLSERRWRLAGLGFCLLMLCVHVAAGLNSSSVPDSWRDMYWASSIAHGERFPLAGPQIYQLFELGPWWFYLLAVPMRLTGSVAATMAFVQLLAALKYVLAWRIGIRIAGARLGLAFATSLAIAGWSTIPLMFPSHTAVIETTCLLLVLVAWRCAKEFSAHNAILLGLASAACLHAHPTTVSYVAIAGIFVLWRHRSWRAFGWMGVAATLAALTLLPPWLDRGIVVTNALKSVPSYLGHDVAVQPWLRIPAVVDSLVVGGAWLGLLLMSTWKAGVVKVAWWLYCGGLVLAASGLMRIYRDEPRLFRIALAASAIFLLQIAFVVALRPITPMWMVPSCLPPLAMVIAIGWYGWLHAAHRIVRVAGIAAMGVCTALALVPFSTYLRELKAVREMPGANPYINVIEHSDHYVNVAVPFYPIRRIDRIAGELCGPAVLHARLATIVEATFATPIRNACGYWPELRYGGIEGHGPHIAGLLPRAATASGIAPARVIAHMALYDRVRAIAPAAGGVSAPLRRLQINPDGGAVFAKSVFDFDTRAGDVVVLTNRMRNAAPLTVDAAVADGKPAAGLSDDGGSLLYGCVHCMPTATVHWHMEVTGVEANLDLVVLLHDPLKQSDTDASSYH